MKKTKQQTIPTIKTGALQKGVGFMGAIQGITRKLTKQERLQQKRLAQ